MSTIVKVIEVVAQSDKSFDDAVRNAVQETAKTLSGITSVWVDNLSAEVYMEIGRASCRERV